MPGSEPAKTVWFTDVHERQLIEAAQRDRVRFGEVYEKYFYLVYAYVARRVHDRPTAEDLTSEVFHKALANLPRFKWTGAPFGAWLIRIASNLIADRAKRNAREGTTPVPAVDNPKPAKQTQQSALEECERRAQLFKLVQGLAEDQRRVVEMRFTQEKSIREIAEELERSEGAVKQLQFRALQNLRAQLANEE